ncbi:ABC transporter ATP-binding protein [Flavitalea antarctica]
MSDLAIKVENVSKQYRIGEVSTGNLTHDLNRWWHEIRGKQNPYLQIGEENDRSKKGSVDYVWALRDIDFQLNKGEVLGIIGRNGAGKSTLLKILSRTTAPTTGSMKIKGRLASLLEVGTGFHPELTGRDNIFLNGAILGMQKNEIKRKFDEIVDFSGVERYIDTPVKRYSSGMYVRLAFAVAAYLESEILIIDEVLAVGDAEFQKKCLGKMGDVSRAEGRTILFVSHNMSAITSLCNSILFLENGKVTFSGDKEKGINMYRSANKKSTLSADLLTLPLTQNYGPKKYSKLIAIELRNSQNELSASFQKNSQIRVRVKFELLENVSDLEIGYAFTNYNGALFGGVINTWDKFQSFFEKGVHIVQSSIDALSLVPGSYSLVTWIKRGHEGIDNEIEDAIEFEVISNNLNGQYINYDKYPHLGFHHESTWEIIN